MTKLWGGRFAGAQDPAFESFQRSLPFDRRLWREDVRGSVAWAQALGDAQVLTAPETKKIVSALARIESELSKDDSSALPIATGKAEVSRGEVLPYCRDLRNSATGWKQSSPG